MPDIDLATPATDTPQGERPQVRLAPGRHKRARAGHPWVYSNEIEMDATARQLEPGGVVRLVAHGGQDLGTAFFNRQPLIAARL